MQHQAMMAQRMAKMGGMNNADQEQVLLNAQRQELLRQKHEGMRNRYPDTRYKRPSQAMMPQRGQYQGPGAYVPPKPKPQVQQAGTQQPRPAAQPARQQTSGIQKLPSPKRDRMPDLRQDTHPYIPD